MICSISAFNAFSGYYNSGMRMSCYFSGQNVAPTSITTMATTTATTLETDRDGNSTVENNQISTTKTDDGQLRKNNFGRLNFCVILSFPITN